MIIEITPFDTLCFRKGRSFNRGEDNWGKTIFPPAPSVIYGALRAVYLFHNEEQLKHAGTEKDPTNDLIIKSIHYKNDQGELLYPLPRDCVKEKKNTDASKQHKTALLLQLQTDEESHIVNSTPDKLTLLKSHKTVVGIEEGLVTSQTLSSYLNSDKAIFPYELLNEYYTIESKTGIKIDSITKTVENKPVQGTTAVEGCLYHLDMVRLSKKRENTINNLSIVVEFENLVIPDEGLIKLGGQGKASVYSAIQKDRLEPNLTPNIHNNLFKLYLSTPAKFKNGWLPSWIDSDTLTGEHQGITMRLVSAAIGSSESIGGYDIKEGRAKPTYKCVPSGSIYIFQSDEPKEEIINTFHARSISDYDSEEGFGIVYVGGVQN